MQFAVRGLKIMDNADLLLVQGKLSQQQVAWDAFVLLIGIACAASGTASSVLAILRQSSAA